MKSQDVFKSKVNPARTYQDPFGTGESHLSKVFVGLSGGVDSSVSAALLKRAGYEVTGVFIKVWQPDFIECTWKNDRLDAMRVCAKLDIPFVELNLEKEYKKEVVDYMIAEYKAGKTPNPDVMCNKQIKFGAFYKWALAQGADYVATGHYTRIVKRKTYNAKRKNEKIKSSSHPLHATRYTLHVASDTNKDQSYFLWQLKQEQLGHILFPVGGMLKPEVRRLAKKFGLITADKKDSQGLCFLGKIDMKEFLKNYIKPKPGNVLLAPSGVEGNEKSEIIGTHDGATFFTLGERHAFTVKTAKLQNAENKAHLDQKPYYVVAKDIKKNTLTVSHDPKVSVPGNSRTIFEIEKVNWISGLPTSSSEPRGVTLTARLRYRQPLQKARFKIQDSRFKIVFEEPQSGGDSGQSIVFYDGEQCLGGGIIV